MMRNWMLIGCGTLIMMGCSLESHIGSLEPIKGVTVPFMQKMEVAGFASGSDSAAVSTGSYQSKHTIGSFQSEIKTESAAGYKLYLNIDGQMASE